MKKYYIFIILFLIAIVFFILKGNSFDKSGKTKLSDTSIAEERNKQINTVAYGLEYPNGEYIDNGTPLEVVLCYKDVFNIIIKQ